MTRARRYLHDLCTLPADAALAFRHQGLGGVWNALATRSLPRLVRAGRLTIFAQA